VARGKADLKAKLLLAAVEFTGGDTTRDFTMEELLVTAWKADSTAWGLRGFEKDHPDSERVHRELDSRGRDQQGLIASGHLEKVRARVYRLTLKGLREASALDPDKAPLAEKLNREMETKVRSILEHQVFRLWLKDPDKPTNFRDAGHFWDVAPGTPPDVISKRILDVDDLLLGAEATLDDRGVDEMVDGRARILFDREDLRRARAFQSVLKERFKPDIEILGATIS
jgi:hypothetical protein